MVERRKLKVIRAIVRPDRRTDYLARWAQVVRSVESAGGRAWLFEDQALTGRFIEFIEFESGSERASEVLRALEASRLGELCARREGDDLLYGEVDVG